MVRWPLFLLALAAITACNPKAVQPERPPPAESGERAELIRQLPADADITRIEEQLTWVPRGFYITRTGRYEPLAKGHPARRLNLRGRPAVLEERAGTIQLRPITLTLPESR